MSHEPDDTTRRWASALGPDARDQLLEQHPELDPYDPEHPPPSIWTAAILVGHLEHDERLELEQALTDRAAANIAERGGEPDLEHANTTWTERATGLELAVQIPYTGGEPHLDPDAKAGPDTSAGTLDRQRRR